MFILILPEIWCCKTNAMFNIYIYIYMCLFLFWISHYSIWFPKLHRFQKIKWYYFQILKNKYLTPDTKKYEGSKNNRFNKHSAPRQHLARRGTCEPMGALPWSRFLESEKMMEVIIPIPIGSARTLHQWFRVFRKLFLEEVFWSSK